MAKLQENFDFGNTENATVQTLVNSLQRMYTDIALAVNKKPDVYQRSTPGQTSDTFLSNGDININTATLSVEMLTEHSSSTAVVWTTLS